jgi:NADH-quinone oxidoreductase subunit G
MGPWDGDRATMGEHPRGAASGEGLRLATWKQMLDNGSLQDGDKHLAATARAAVVRVSATMYDALGPAVTVTGDRGSVTLPAEITEDLVDSVVWVPANSSGRGLLTDVASPGTRVTVKGGTT